MNGFSVVAPLKYDKNDGPYLMNKNLKDVVKQNFKMLLLTNKGERVMDTNFGVGLKSLLFFNRTETVSSIDIDSAIRSQVSRYLPFIILNDIIISDILPQEQNTVFLQIDYSIPSIKEKDSISLILNNF